MRINSISFHLICLLFTVLSIAMFVSSREPAALAGALFFGGGWVATRAIGAGNVRRPWLRLIGGFATLLVAAGSLLLVFLGDPVAMVIGVIGAAFFGICGVLILLGRTAR